MPAAAVNAGGGVHVGGEEPLHVLLMLATAAPDRAGCASGSEPEMLQLLRA